MHRPTRCFLAEGISHFSGEKIGDKKPLCTSIQIGFHSWRSNATWSAQTCKKNLLMDEANFWERLGDGAADRSRYHYFLVVIFMICMSRSLTVQPKLTSDYRKSFFSSDCMYVTLTPITQDKRNGSLRTHRHFPSVADIIISNDPLTFLVCL